MKLVVLTSAVEKACTELQQRCELALGKPVVVVCHIGLATHLVFVLAADHSRLAADEKQSLRDAATVWAKHQPTSTRIDNTRYGICVRLTGKGP